MLIKPFLNFRVLIRFFGKCLFKNKIVIELLDRSNLIKYFNFTVSVNEMKIPLIAGLGYDNILGTEKWMSEVLEFLIPKIKGCFLDIGVNIGQTLIKVKAINRDIIYIGFEPNPVCVFYSERLIEVNEYPFSTIIPCGVSNNNEIVTLKYFSENKTDSSASIIDQFRPDSKVLQEKNVVVLNSTILKFDEKISILKIDVEGAEVMVIQGLLNIIEKDRPFILIEILPAYTKENIDRISRQNEIMRILKEIDYSIFKIYKNVDDSLMEIRSIEVIGIHSDLSQCDYLFVPVEKNDVLSVNFV